MVKTVTLTIDHKSVTVPEDTTILEAARKLNIHAAYKNEVLWI